MRLKQIKLAGFKSFVDATKIPFTQQMTAIVGPNGCGKSNIIDAVRWVLGESSAKNLRGDAMTDVIFNGSSTRKPIGQASVELVFENTQGKLQGSLANRNEVSIRRVVTRDAISSYYLNGSKCRRRDITDIFLGTGLGPRSYAIIEQGTISRLIESKPQELRVFIEEAAGISKYKEKRRETENRIRHTRDNLARLTDVIAELNHQIDKLHQQAEAAKRFKTLKARERQYKAELAAMRWQQFQLKAEQYQQKMKAKQVDIEAVIMQQRQIELALVKLQQKNTDKTENIALLQQQKYQLSNDIARIEQTIKYQKQQKLLQAQQCEKLHAEHEKQQQQLANEIIKQQQLTAQVAQQQPELDLLNLQLEQSQFNVQDKQEALQLCLEQWEKANQQLSEHNALLATINAKLHAHQQNVIQAQQLIAATQKDIDDLTEKANSLSLNVLAQEVKQQRQVYDELYDKKQQLQHESAILQPLKEEAQQLLFTYKAKLQTVEENLAQLQVQDQQLPQWQKKQQNFLAKELATTKTCSKTRQPVTRLYQQLVVEEGWQKSVSIILSSWLSSDVVNALPPVSLLSKAPDILLLINNDTSEQPYIKVGTLAEKVSGNILVNSLLNKIYYANDLAQAERLIPQLAVDESVMCIDGTWLGHHFIRRGSIDSQDDVLQRHNQLRLLTEQQTKLQKSVIAQEKQVQHLIDQQQTITQENSALTEKLAKLSVEIQSKNQALALAEQAEQHIKVQLAQLQQRKQQQQNELQQHQQLMQKYQQEKQQLLAAQQESAQQSLSELTEQREHLQHEIVTLQAMVQQFQQQYHQLTLAIEKAKVGAENSYNVIQQLQQSIAKLTDEISQLSQPEEVQSASLLAQENQLQQWLTQLSRVDEKVVKLQTALADAEQKANEYQQQKLQKSSEVEHLKIAVNQYYLDSENFQLRAQTALEQLLEMQQDVHTVLANMSKEANESAWQGNIVRIAKEVAQLGPINLAAIAEYEQEVTRKSFLDQQYDDLTAAINTLESAIAKIDRQSRQKFKTTFDQINDGFKSLFPHVFGGGSAYLALTGDDLLETGVTIMARPPGKKNSTIHLLSGGEKALTALSLVFAIFRLNPAPFCMLDEVDAPLDDANVVRFCNLVQEMSQNVQFIYISHNKIAMEMASHLTGVTMFEAGVSRMVSVDIDEAIAMAELSS
jgi:chromosome segregation protein